MAVNVKVIVVAGAGFVLVYSGVKGLGVSTTFRDLLTGKNPEKETTQEPVLPNNASSGTSSSTGSGLGGAEGGAGARQSAKNRTISGPVPTITGTAQQLAEKVSQYWKAGPTGQIPAQTLPGGQDRATPTFVKLFLHYIGAPATAANVHFFQVWSEREGDGGENNPFNTTYVGTLKGTTPLTYNGKVYGVRNYVNIAQGAYATAATFLGGNYNDIVEAAREGNLSTSTDYAGLSTWSGGGYSNLGGE